VLNLKAPAAGESLIVTVKQPGGLVSCQWASVVSDAVAAKVPVTTKTQPAGGVASRPPTAAQSELILARP
jgi:hypothetical protein